ncbi:hypothetical protein EGR_10659 [Echinococcus granulosus]|uniref:Uncharacterized protein n=1 Tax=Echinococcus granulosus TaxID=6210 RepID=W6U1U4_ECHGR|nr:hypothetical protein EGR_10659 [Echinococcus granulosus]EUB54491.1 hypothetical protein EGR_10659 [Echinococcus granulosus]
MSLNCELYSSDEDYRLPRGWELKSLIRLTVLSNILVAKERRLSEYWW